MDGDVTVAFTIQLDISIDRSVLSNPQIRYTFIDNKQVITKPIGEGDWIEVTDSCVDDTKVDISLGMQSSPPFPTYRYTHHYESIAMDDAMIHRINNYPFLSFILSNITSDKEILKSSLSSQLFWEKFEMIYVDTMDVDLSPLLCGDVVIFQKYGQNDDTSRMKRRSNPTTCHFPTPPLGVKSMCISIQVDKCILSSKRMHHLNPITVKIMKATQLPVIRVFSKGLTTTTVPHHLQENYCEPVRLTFRFFDFPFCSRRTVGLPSNELIVWNQKLVFLAFNLDQAELYENFHSNALLIEVHDQDIRKVGWLAEMKELLDKSSTIELKEINLMDMDTLFLSKREEKLMSSGTTNAHGVASFRLKDLLYKMEEYDTKWNEGKDPPSTEIHPKKRDSSHHLQLKADIIQQKKRSHSSETTQRNPKHNLELRSNSSNNERLIIHGGNYVESGAQLLIHVTLYRLLHKRNSFDNNDNDNDAHVAKKEVNDSLSLEVDPSSLEKVNPSLEREREREMQTSTKNDDYQYHEKDSYEPLALFGRMVFYFPYEETELLHNLLDTMDQVNRKSLLDVSLKSYQLTEEEKVKARKGELDILCGFQIIDRQRLIVVEGLAKKGISILAKAISRKRMNTENYKILCNPNIHFHKRLYVDFDVDLKKIKLRNDLSRTTIMPEIYMRSKVSLNCCTALCRLNDMTQANSLEELKELNLFPTVQMLLEMESKFGEFITIQDIEGYETFSSTKSIHSTDNQHSTNETNQTNEDISTKRDYSFLSETSSLKVSTDSYNKEYLQFKKLWKPKDYIEENKIIQGLVAVQHKSKKKELEEENRHYDVTPKYMYSGQKLQSSEIMKEEMQKRLSKDRTATYTYSKEFQSLAFEMKNISLDKNDCTLRRRRFIYPAPRLLTEYNQHPKAVSKSRKEELEQPWIENSTHPRNVEREWINLDGKQPFQTLPSKDMIFGGYTKNGKPNPHYFKSIHLTGDGLEKEREEDKRKEHEIWLSKVVVDQHSFQAYGNTCGQGKIKPSQLDRTTDILASPLQSKTFKRIRNTKLPSGKKIPFDAAPISITSSGPYAELKKENSLHFVGRDHNKNVIDFKIYNRIEEEHPHSKQSKKVILPLVPSEKVGPKWRSGVVNKETIFSSPQ